MNSKDIRKYKHIAELNQEAFQSLKSIGLTFNIIENNKLILTLIMNDEMQETEEWIGFVQTIKIYIKKHLLRATDSI